MPGPVVKFAGWRAGSVSWLDDVSIDFLCSALRVLEIEARSQNGAVEEGSGKGGDDDDDGKEDDDRVGAGGHS